MSELLFINGPFDGQFVEVGDVLFQAIDVCEPVDGSDPVIFRMVRPNNGIWTYHLSTDEVSGDQYYEGVLISENISGVLISKVWTKVGNFEVYNPTDNDVPINSRNQAVEFSGWRVRLA